MTVAVTGPPKPKPVKLISRAAIEKAKSRTTAQVSDLRNKLKEQDGKLRYLKKKADENSKDMQHVATTVDLDELRENLKRSLTATAESLTRLEEVQAVSSREVSVRLDRLDESLTDSYSTLRGETSDQFQQLLGIISSLDRKRKREPNEDEDSESDHDVDAEMFDRPRADEAEHSASVSSDDDLPSIQLHTDSDSNDSDDNHPSVGKRRRKMAKTNDTPARSIRKPVGGVGEADHNTFPPAETEIDTTGTAEQNRQQSPSPLVSPKRTRDEEDDRNIRDKKKLKGGAPLTNSSQPNVAQAKFPDHTQSAQMTVSQHVLDAKRQTKANVGTDSPRRRRRPNVPSRLDNEDSPATKAKSAPGNQKSNLNKLLALAEIQPVMYTGQNLPAAHRTQITVTDGAGIPIPSKFNPEMASNHRGRAINIIPIHPGTAQSSAGPSQLAQAPRPPNILIGDCGIEDTILEEPETPAPSLTSHDLLTTRETKEDTFPRLPGLPPASTRSPVPESSRSGTTERARDRAKNQAFHGGPRSAPNLDWMVIAADSEVEADYNDDTLGLSVPDTPPPAPEIPRPAAQTMPYSPTMPTSGLTHTPAGALARAIGSSLVRQPLN